MAMRMKGLLRGLRYISNKFEVEEKEQEMQIGFPTDVEHVAHIGWDSHSSTSPGWMNDLTPKTMSEPLTCSPSIAATRSECRVSPSPMLHGRDDNSVGRSSARDLPAMPLPKPSKRSPSSLAAAGANSDLPRVTRNSRRHRSSVASPDRNKFDSSRLGRRERSATASSSDMSLQEEQPVAEATKQRRRKIRGSSSCGGSSRPSRTKAGGGKGVEKELPQAKTTRGDDNEEEG